MPKNVYIYIYVKSVSILIFDQNSIKGRYFQRPRGILDAIIIVKEDLNSLGTLYIARFHTYALLLRDPEMIPSCSWCPPPSSLLPHSTYSQHVYNMNNEHTCKLHEHKIYRL